MSRQLFIGIRLNSLSIPMHTGCFFGYIDNVLVKVKFMLYCDATIFGVYESAR